VDVIGDALEIPHRAFVPNVKLVRGGHYGNAILSRFTLDDVENVDLTIKPKKRRSALTATAHVHEGGHQRMLVLANLHLGLSGIERGMQLRRLVKSRPLTQHRRSTPFLLGGDFNDVWNTLGPKFLELGGFRRAGPLLPTYPATLPVRSLDGLFLRGDVEPQKLFRSRMRLAREASDHLPLFAEIRLTV
jgi:endonuclease/exonuclease/phosphatase family metal-dependent hydrolase